MFFLTDQAGALGLRQLPQHVAGFDAYDLGSALLALSSGLVLGVRLIRHPGGARGLRQRQRPVDELLICLVLIGLGVLLLHQFVTDGICHGACNLYLSAR